MRRLIAPTLVLVLLQGPLSGCNPAIEGSYEGTIDIGCFFDQPGGGGGQHSHSQLGTLTIAADGDMFRLAMGGCTVPLRRTSGNSLEVAEGARCASPTRELGAELTLSGTVQTGDSFSGLLTGAPLAGHQGSTGSCTYSLTGTRR